MSPNINYKDFHGNDTNLTRNEVDFLKPIFCQNVNSYSYKVTVALFLGWFGRRLTLPRILCLGLLKFHTAGFCGIGSLIDFVLISMQIIGL